MKEFDRDVGSASEAEAIASAKAKEFIDEESGQFLILRFPPSLADMVDAHKNKAYFEATSFIGALYPVPEGMEEQDEAATLAAQIFLVRAAASYYARLSLILIAQNPELLAQMKEYNAEAKKRGLNEVPTWENL
jgi:hypothetical protein